MRRPYHRYFSEAQGKETSPTFFLHRHVEKQYHIDYGFADSQWVVKSVEVGAISDRLAESDHLPVVFDLERAD